MFIGISTSNNFNNLDGFQDIAVPTDGLSYYYWARTFSALYKFSGSTGRRQRIKKIVRISGSDVTWQKHQIIQLKINFKNGKLYFKNLTSNFDIGSIDIDINRVYYRVIGICAKNGGMEFVE